MTVTNEITFMNKLRAHKIQGMFAVIQSRIFSRPVSYRYNIAKITYKTVILPVILYGGRK